MYVCFYKPQNFNKNNNYWAEIKKTNSLIMKCIIEYIFHYLGEDLVSLYVVSDPLSVFL